MKKPTEQDPRITRELGNYRLAPPSPDLHDRVLRAAREAMASGDVERHWTDRLLRAHGTFGRGILAFASTFMLILGIILQLGGDHSVLADSLERLKVMVTISGNLYVATAMDCTVLKADAPDGKSQYRIRWNADGVSRIDMGSSSDKRQTLWISKGAVSVTNDEDTAVRSMTVQSLPSQWQQSMEFLTPAMLVRQMDKRYGLTQAERKDGAGPNEFLIRGREDLHAVEITVDARTYLPKTLKKYALDSDRAGRNPVCLMEARFIWNQPIPRELFVPGPLEGKH